MIRRILVPVDGSTFAEAALPLALALSEKAGAAVRLAMVNQPPNLPPGVWAEAFLANHAQYIESIAESVSNRAAPEVAVSSVLLEGEVAAALCAEASSAGVDLVVMSTHGHGGLTRMWLGSVADRVLGEAPVPVLLVRPSEDDSVDPAESTTISRILVPLDGTPFAEAALDPAFEIGRLFGASFVLLRTVTYPVVATSYLPDTVQVNEAFVRHAKEDARVYLEAVRARFDDGSGRVDIDVLVGHSSATTILDQVADSGADLVVMASHGRHGFARAALGSVTDKVLRGSHTPVLIVHPSDLGRPERSEEVS